MRRLPSAVLMSAGIWIAALSPLSASPTRLSEREHYAESSVFCGASGGCEMCRRASSRPRPPSIALIGAAYYALASLVAGHRRRPVADHAGALPGLTGRARDQRRPVRVQAFELHACAASASSRPRSPRSCSSRLSTSCAALHPRCFFQSSEKSASGDHAQNNHFSHSGGSLAARSDTSEGPLGPGSRESAAVVTTSDVSSRRNRDLCAMRRRRGRGDRALNGNLHDLFHIMINGNRFKAKVDTQPQALAFLTIPAQVPWNGSHPGDVRPLAGQWSGVFDVRGESSASSDRERGTNS